MNPCRFTAVIEVFSLLMLYLECQEVKIDWITIRNKQQNIVFLSPCKHDIKVCWNGGKSDFYLLRNFRYQNIEHDKNINNEKQASPIKRLTKAVFLIDFFSLINYRRML